jgi:folylpolyglutamate synthase/dihydropteroate synthase
MMWHVSHRHEAPQALEALGKTYDEKLASLQQDNAKQAQEIDELKTKLDNTEKKFLNMSLNVIKEQEQNVNFMLQIRNMANNQSKLVFALVLRDQVLKQRLGITLPDPFRESNDNQSTTKST